MKRLLLIVVVLGVLLMAGCDYTGENSTKNGAAVVQGGDYSHILPVTIRWINGIGQMTIIDPTGLKTVVTDGEEAVFNEVLEGTWIIQVPSLVNDRPVVGIRLNGTNEDPVSLGSIKGDVPPYVFKVVRAELRSNHNNN